MILIRIFLLVFIPYALFAQNTENVRLRQDYPKCAEQFPIKNQSATYVFAIDFSTSMQPLESIVKENLRMFINSLPEGDKITLIKEGQTNETDYIYIPNAPISSVSRQSIIRNLTAVSFDQNASDGFKLTEKIIEAIDQTGGNELIYIFIFTDFEYYTSINHYNKNQCDWNKLQLKYSGIEKGKKIMKVGLELPASNLHPEAIFKTDLDKVFNGIKYYKIVDGGSLASWFADIRANILRDRLRFVVEKKIDEEKIHTKFHLKPSSGSSHKTWVENEGELIKSFTLLSPKKLLKGTRPWVEWPFGDNSSAEGEVLLTFNDRFLHSKGYNEIEKLVQDSQQKTVKLIVHKPEAYFSLISVAIFLLILIVLTTCFLITCLSRKLFNSLRINTEGIDAKTFNSTKQVLIGSNINSLGRSLYLIPEVNKQIEIFYRHKCPCKLWIKSGVYIRANQGNQISFILMGKKEKRSLMAGSVEYLAPFKKFIGVSIEFDENDTHYTIKVRK